jgi:Lipid A 3-O-deacylase (PagL)
MNCGQPVRALAAMLFSSVALHAGLCSPSGSEPRNDFQFFAGYSPATSTLIGTTTDRRLVVAGFSYSYACWIWKSVTLSYTTSVLPAAIMLEPSETLYNFVPPYVRSSPAHAVYGFAVAPLGFTLEIAPAHRIHPFAETLEGIIASTEPIPENLPDASGLNFLFDLGGGVRWKVAPRRAISIGYRFLHISNASTTSFNPGVDNNVIYLGFSFQR